MCYDMSCGYVTTVSAEWCDRLCGYVRWNPAKACLLNPSQISSQSQLCRRSISAREATVSARSAALTISAISTQSPHASHALVSEITFHAFAMLYDDLRRVLPWTAVTKRKYPQRFGTVSEILPDTFDDTQRSTTHGLPQWL